jgi:hypothetical protein
VQGHSPYRLELLFERGNPVWLHTAIGALFPLGWLPFQYAANIWLIVNIAIMLAIIAIVSGKRLSISLFFIVALIVFLFPPTITHLQIGQFSLMVTFIVIIVAFFSHKLWLPVAALLLVIAMAKPQLVVLVIPGLLVGIFRLRGAKTALLFCLLMFGAFLLLSVPVFIAEPGWLTDYFNSFQQNPTWLQPSLFSLLPLQFGTVGIVIWLLFAISIFVLNIFIWWNFPLERAVLWSLALTPLITPYIWSWDSVLMLPLFVAMIIEAKRRRTVILLVGGFIILWIGTVSLSMSGDVGNELFWWIPYFVLALILIAMWLEHRLSFWPEPIFEL